MAVSVKKIFRSLGVGLYVFVTRTAIALAVVFTALFFILNSSHFPDRLAGLLVGVIPGSFEFGRIQTSPIPWMIDVTDVKIKTPTGKSIITAGSVRVRVDLLPLLKFVMNTGSRELKLHVNSVKINNFKVLLQFDKANHLELVDAFASQIPRPVNPNPFNFILQVDKVTASDGQAVLEFPDWDLTVKGIDLKASVDLHTRDIHVLVKSEFVNYLSGIGHIHFAPGIDQIPRDIKLRQGFIDGAVYNWDEISFERFRSGFDFGALDAQKGYLSWVKNLKYSLSAALQLPDGSHVVKTATGDQVSGPMDIRLKGSGDKSNLEFSLEVDSPRLRAVGLELGHVTAAVTGGRDQSGQYRFGNISAMSRWNDTAIDLVDGVFYPGSAAGPVGWKAGAGLSFTALDTARVLEVMKIKLQSDAVPVPGSIGGDFKLTVSSESPPLPGPYVLPPELKFGLAGKVSGELEKRGVLDARTFSLDVDAAISGVDLHKPLIDVSALHIVSGTDRLSLAGLVDFGRDRLIAEGSLIKSVSSLVRPFGLKMDGIVSLARISFDGLLSSPTGVASATVTDFAVDKWQVSTATAEVGLLKGNLMISQLNALSSFARLQVESGKIPLLASPGSSAPDRIVELTDISVTKVDLARIPQLVGAGVYGSGQVRARSLSFDMTKPLKTVSSRLAADLDNLVFAGRELQHVSVQAFLDGGLIKTFTADSEVKGGGSLTVSGMLDFANDVIDVTGNVTDVPLKTLMGGGSESDVSGLVSAGVAVSGSLVDPAISGDAGLRDFVWQEYRVAPVTVTGTRKKGGDLFLSGEEVFRGVKFGPQARVIWKNGKFSGLYLDFDIVGLTPQDVIPDISPRKFTGSLTADLHIEVPFSKGGYLRAQLDSAPDALWLEFFNRQVRLENKGALAVRFEPGGRLLVAGLRLDDGESSLLVCGEHSPSGLNVMLRGSVGALWLRGLKNVISSARGSVNLSAVKGRPAPALPIGCTAAMLQEGGPLVVRGTIKNPLIDGMVSTGDIDFDIRKWSDSIRIQSGGQILFKTVDEGGKKGYTKISIPEDHWITGSVGDGAFNVSGSAVFDNGRFSAGDIKLKGSQIRYVSAGQYYIVAEPRLDVTFDHLGKPVDGSDANLMIAGQVNISEGSYHRNFNIVRKAFSGVTGGRVAERSSQASLAGIPWLADAKLDVGIRASAFGVRTRLVVGRTDLDLALNLRLRGTLGYPELWDRVEVLPGGTFTYDVVRREFEIVRGIVDFDGEVLQPIMDIQARTRIEYKGASGNAASASRFAGDEGRDSFYGDMIQVNLAVTGRYPDIDIQVSSPTKGISQGDLQVLLLTGIAPGDSVGGSAGSFVNVDLLTGGVTDSLVKVLLANLVDSVSFGVTAGGNVNVDVSAHMGRRMKFQTQVMQGSGASQYSAGFKLRLTEGLSLEGRLRAVEYSVDQSDVGRNYDTKLRYRIPLE